MSGMPDLLADLVDGTDLPPSYADETRRSNEARSCDGCFEVKPDVDLWAANDHTGDELWLCEACVEF